MCKIRSLSFILLLVIAACAGNDKPSYSLHDKIIEANKVVIYEYNWENSSEPNIKLAELYGNEVEELKKLLSSGMAIENTCEYQGSIVFFKDKERLMNVRFNVNDSCRQLVFMINNELKKYQISTSGLEFLKSKISSSNLI